MTEHSNFITDIHKPIHPSWRSFLTPAVEKLLADIEVSVSDCNYTPNSDRALHFLTTNLEAAKIIIIGQDPYPQQGIATGRAFEVSTLKNWSDTFRNVSLKNIIRLLYKTYNNEYLKYKEIIKQSSSNLFHSGFKISPPNQLFKNWEEQGVLLLNTSFTCNIGSPGSHTKHWKPFTSKLLSYINDKNPEIKWFLWGKHAQNATKDINILHKIESHHPMICKPGVDEDFLFGKNNCFELTKNDINWTGIYK